MIDQRSQRTTATVIRLPDGRDLGFAEYGDPAGVPVIAFHGTPGSRLQLAPVHDAATTAGVRLIVPDRPGYGHSDFAPRRRLLDWPGDVDVLADHLGLARFAVLGVSGGGPHALACAFALPHHLSAVIVVSGPAPIRSPGVLDGLGPRQRRLLGLVGSERAVRPGAELVVGALRHFPYLMARLAWQWMPPADRRLVADPEALHSFVDEARRSSPTAGRAAAQDVAMFSRPWGFDLGDIDVPVEVWHGEDDRLVEARHASVLTSAIPGATLRLIPGGGHLLFADAVADILERAAGKPAGAGLAGAGQAWADDAGAAVRHTPSPASS